jgi:hypothetical protein
MRFLRRIAGPALLVFLAVWALAMVVPDLRRLAQPLGSFGLYANNDGLITDVQGPFPDEGTSPAYLAGLRAGQRLDLGEMRCAPVDTLRCASALAVLGGLRLVSVGRHAILFLTASADEPARQVELVAKQRPVNPLVFTTLLLDQLAAIAVILAAAWLVWTRPGRMTWGFFLYVIWFNPGQSDAYYALLQNYPAALLTQNIAGAIAEGAGYAGFIQFSLRAPGVDCAPSWRLLERALPAIAVLLAILLALSYANVFGFPTEQVTRIGISSGFAVPIIVIFILLARREELAPHDYQRLRWVIWGALIGLPAIILADLGEGTSLLASLLGGQSPPEEVWGLVRLVNGVLCLFVFEAVRRPRVVTVAIPLRRVTILGLLLSAPAMILHEEIGRMREAVSDIYTLPGWVWFAIAVGGVFAISRLHESFVHLADRYFNRAVARAGKELGEAILKARHTYELEALLVGGVRGVLGLSSASIFRDDDGVLRREAGSEGWDEGRADELDPADPMLAPMKQLRQFDVDAKHARRNNLPDGLALPVLAVPIANRFRCFALAFYGSHATGADLNHDDRGMVAEIADVAAAVFEKLYIDDLRKRIADLEHVLEKNDEALKPRLPAPDLNRGA